jgi:hypothetical protein
MQWRAACITIWPMLLAGEWLGAYSECAAVRWGVCPFFAARAKVSGGQFFGESPEVYAIFQRDILGRHS